MQTLWAWLLRSDHVETRVSVTNAWIMLAALVLFCLYLLSRKVRAREVVK
jgi:hypothetical protein